MEAMDGDDAAGRDPWQLDYLAELPRWASTLTTLLPWGNGQARAVPVLLGTVC